ncbi:MAG: UDP-N-acetylmuramoyl-L-alanyl-D-glutamate--2,6-diaminopimelate ligase [Gammaproteobacteria bacterium]|nr:MAG: UDP-N-acetylmuramoyl-L-alanyl-D-glutamate--2,6-diaminopimelate ligase [Gammaproteobacteria bacterium]
MAAQKHKSGVTLSALLEGLCAINPSADRLITGVCMDSRTVKPGDLFIACRGGNVDGSVYIPEAIDKGAIAVLLEKDLSYPGNAKTPVIPIAGLRQEAGRIVARFMGDPSSADLRVIGVTGTNGKSSVAWILAHLLARIDGFPTGLVGTLGYGYPNRLRAGAHTTPDPVVLQGLLAGFRDDGAKAVVMEVSSQGLHQGRVSGVSFDTAIFTNLSQDHLDYHGDMTAYAEAKKQLFLMPGLRHAAINLDDAFGVALADEMKTHALDLAGYRLVDDWRNPAGAIPQMQARILEATLESQRLEIRGPWGEGDVRVTLPGRYNAYNLLACLTAMCLQGAPFAEALRGLADAPQVPGRLERFGGGDQPAVIVDYAHTPDALAKVLAVLREGCNGRLICVFGCGGNRDAGKRALMGGIAEAYADRIVVTNDNPRQEDPDKIVADILGGINDRQKVAVEKDRRLAIIAAIESAAAGDIVLVAGKGHESTQDIAGTQFPFSDRQVVIAALANSSGVRT